MLFQVLQGPRPYPEVAHSASPRTARCEQNICSQQRTERTIRFIVLQRTSVMGYEPLAVLLLIVAQLSEMFLSTMSHAPVRCVPGNPRMYGRAKVGQHSHTRKNESCNQPTMTGLFPV